MSERTQVDPDKLIRGGETLHGQIAVSSLPELAERLAGPDGAVAWTLHGGRDAHGRARLELALSGKLQLVCQRCLGVLAHDFDYRHTLVLVRDEARLPELDDEEEDADFVVVPGLFDVKEAVLEELLLALPMMPRHDTGQCEGPEAGPETGPEADAGEGPSPFSALRGSRGS